MNWPVVVLLLVVVATVGGLVGRRAVGRPGPWVIGALGAAVLGPGLLFVPVRCATGQVATPFNDVTGQPSPTGCSGVAGLELPELGPFAGDTVGYGLAITAAGLVIVVAGAAANRATRD